MKGISRAEQCLLLAAIAAVLIFSSLDRLYFRSGFSAFDEESVLDLLQAWREGAPLYFRFGNGSLSRALSCALTGAFGPDLSLLYAPSQLAIAAEALLLFVWLRPRLGERAALWASLADLLCATTFARSRSLVSPVFLPCLFLAHAVALDHLKRLWQHALWGASALFFLLDYEGWGLALLWLGPAWAVAQGRGPGAARRWAAVLAGAAASAALVFSQNLDLGSHLAERSVLSKPQGGVLREAWANLLSLLGPGRRVPFSGADGHPWLAPWLWPLLPLGAATLWTRHKGAWGLLAVGLLPLLLKGSALEPHRFSLALLAVAAAAGCGAAKLWRWRHGALALAALLSLGVALEARAWSRSDPQRLARSYGRPRDLIAATRWMKAHQPAEGWALIDGIGPYFDGSFRFLLDAEGVRRDGSRPIVLVHGDYAQGLKGLRGGLVSFDGTGRFPTLLFLPGPAEAARLQAVQAELAPFQRASLRAWPGALRAEALAKLQNRGVRDPWSRTVYWEAWMQAQRRLHAGRADEIHASLREPLVSGWIFDFAAAGFEDQDPALAEALRRRALAIDPRRASLPDRAARD